MPALIPLMSHETYDKFAALHAEMVRSGIENVAKVFVPIGMEPGSTVLAAPRVLIVGKATRDWGQAGLSTFVGASNEAAKIVGDWLPHGRSAFWQFARAILRRTLRACDIQVSDSELPSFCGWSNLAKIGDVRGNPPPASLSIQKKLCIEALRSEIAYFKPSAVVVVTQNYAQHEITYPLFGHDDGSWSFDTPGKDRVAFKLHDDLKTAIIWTNHPQGMRPAGTRALVQTFVADLIVRAMRGVPFPPSVVQSRS